MKGTRSLEFILKARRKQGTFKGRNGGVTVTRGEFGCYSKHNGKPT